MSDCAAIDVKNILIPLNLRETRDFVHKDIREIFKKAINMMQNTALSLNKNAHLFCLKIGVNKVLHKSDPGCI